jgi:hypothetical protein
MVFCFGLVDYLHKVGLYCHKIIESWMGWRRELGGSRVRHLHVRLSVGGGGQTQCLVIGVPALPSFYSFLNYY